MKTCVWVAVAVLASACSGGKDSVEPKKENTTVDAKQVAEVCKAVFTRQAECTNEFIPALVDLRIELNIPEGIADEATTVGRDTLIEQAKTEWAEDSKPEGIEAKCEQFSTAMPPAEAAKMMDEGSKCNAESDCAGFTKCAIGIARTQMTAMKAEMSKPPEAPESETPVEDATTP